MISEKHAPHAMRGVKRFSDKDHAQQFGVHGPTRTATERALDALPLPLGYRREFGEPGRVRSDNPRLKRTVLCQLSYGSEDSAGDDPASSNLKGWRSAN